MLSLTHKPSTDSSSISVRRHQFPKHYRIPSNPIEESVYTLVRPKRDVPPPLFKSRFADTVKTEKRSIIATADRLRKTGRAFNSIEQSPIVNTAVGGGGATSILVGTPYDEEDSVRNIIKTSKPSSTGLYATIHKPRMMNRRTQQQHQQQQRSNKIKKPSNVKNKSDRSAAPLTRSETPVEIISSAISKAAESDYIRKSATKKKTSYQHTTSSTAAPSLNTNNHNNNSSASTASTNAPPVPEEDESLARLLQPMTLKQNNNSSSMHQPPFVIDEEIEITPTPLTSTRHAGSSAWNASSATFLHHNTEKSNGNSDVTSNSIRRMAMSEHERVAILAGFRSDWEKLNREFQRMPISTKRMGRKVYLEKELSMIEQNMKEFERI